MTVSRSPRRRAKNPLPHSWRRAYLYLEPLEDRSLLDAGMFAGMEAGGPDAPWEVEPLPTPPLIQQHNLFNYDGWLTGPTAGAPVDIALDFLRSHATELGVTVADFDNVDVWTNYVTDSTGITHLSIRQMLNGLEIENANFNVNVGADGSILNVGGGFVADVARFAASNVTPPIDALKAVERAASQLRLSDQSVSGFVATPSGTNHASVIAASGISREDIPAHLHYVAQEDGTVVLAWDVTIQTTDGAHWYNLSVGADSGSILATLDYASHADYNVYAIPTESPNHGGRSIQTDPHLITPPPGVVPSPFGWHDTNGVAGAEFTITRGNNVNAYTDTNNDNVPDAGSQPDGGAGLVFNFPIDLSQQPSTYRPASVTNLFYWNNIIHDVTYLYGFNEAARNFQVNNYGRGGLGNDAVNAEAQDGGGFNNANFATPPDGSAPRMQMYLGNLVSPMRDGSLDNGVVVHEYGHGISNRLTGNGSGITALQTRGMGEGWSDWFAMMFTQTTAGETTTGRGMGTYLFGQAANGPGIRDYRYDFDIGNIANETFAHYGVDPFAVHRTGTRWASTLWDINHLLIQKYGYEPNLYNSTSSAGNIKAMHLVMNGLKLSPLNPDFLQARNAILNADVALYGGANLLELWTAFARRGLGFSATNPGGAGSTTFNEAYDLPPALGQLSVTSTIPAVGSTVAVPPTSFVVNFTAPYVAGSVQPGDFTVNGIAATGAILTDADTVTFTYGASPVTVQGFPQTMAIAANTILKASDNSGNLAFSGAFRWDAVTLQVTSTVPPTPGGIFTLPSPFIYDVNFNEAVAPGSVGTNDLTLSAGTVTGAFLLDADTVRYTLSGLTTEGTLNISLAAGAVTDTFGNPNAAFNGSYQVDFGTVPYPTPLASKPPPGSLIYDPTINGNIGFAGDVDNFTLNIDPNQTITIIVRPTSAGLQPRVELFDPSNASLGFAQAPAAGQVTGIQTRATTTGGVYRIAVSGGTGNTLGNYNVQVILNAAIELEGLVVGATNDSRPTAQDINGSFINLDTTLAHASRGAVLGGNVDASQIPVTTYNFETLNQQGWTVQPLVGPSLWHVSTRRAGDANHTPVTSFYYGDEVTGNYNFGLNSGAIVSPSFVVPTGAGINFKYFLDTEGGTTWDRATLQISNNGGATWTNLLGPLAESSVFTSASASLAAFAGQTVRVRFHFDTVDSVANTFEGWYVDDVQITAPGAWHDYYSFTAAAGDTVSVALKHLTGAGANVFLENAAGAVLATGVAGATNYDRGISNVLIGTAGTYYVRVTGTTAATYSTTVTRNAAFDTEGNNTLATAQPLAGNQGALGHVIGGVAGASLDNFDDGNLVEYTFLGANASAATLAAAHDGPFGLQLGNFTEWMYRNDAGAQVAQGDTISVWVRAAGAPTGRIYVGFGATPAGTLSMVMGGNTGTLLIQRNAGYGFLDLGSVPQAWIANKWYRFEIAWAAGGAIAGRLFDSDGTTLLNTVNAVDNTITSGGIAFRGFGPTYYVDTVQKGGAGNDDWYKVTLTGDQTAIEVETRTPADGPGQFVNTLNPKIQLFDAGNNDITPAVTILGDGRNEKFRATGLTSGQTYYVKVTGEGNSQGEYFAGIKTLRTPVITSKVDDGLPSTWGPDGSFAVPNPVGNGWTNVTGAGYLNDHTIHADNVNEAANNFAVWNIRATSATPELFATWVPRPQNATNATYEIRQGTTLLKTVTVNQQQAPNDALLFGTVLAESLGTVSLTGWTPSTFVNVRLITTGANGDLVADGVFDPPAEEIQRLTPEVVVQDQVFQTPAQPFTPATNSGFEQALALSLANGNRSGGFSFFGEEPVRFAPQLKVGTTPTLASDRPTSAPKLVQTASFPTGGSAVKAADDFWSNFLNEGTEGSTDKPAAGEKGSETPTDQNKDRSEGEQTDRRPTEGQEEE